MKKKLFFCAVLIMLIACSKEHFEIKKNENKKYISERENVVSRLNLDSIQRMNAGAFLEEKLSSHEIDSIIKMRSELITKSVSNTIAGEEYTDVTGFIHLRLFWSQSSGASHYPHAEAAVTEDYVLVGGGAIASNNQYLYESRPDEQLIKWIASSKDHITPVLHYVTAYAIGMKIDGVTTEYLRSKIHLYSSTSLMYNHPFTSVSIPTNFLLLGGGAYDHWEEDGYLGYGNMLTASFPTNSSTWTAGGKDHRRPDPSRITAYAIGIENIIYPNVGSLQVSSTYSSNSITNPSGGTLTTPLNLPSGWGLTCSGANVLYDYYGRMISQNSPSTLSSSILKSTINYYLDGGTNISWALMIQGGN